MANVAAELPTICVRCEQVAVRWDYNNPDAGYRFHACTNTYNNGGPCHWPVNHWTPESDDYAVTETWMQTWKNLTGIA